MEEQQDDELMFEESERSGTFVRRVVGQEIQRRGNEAVGNYIAFYRPQLQPLLDFLNNIEGTLYLPYL